MIRYESQIDEVTQIETIFRYEEDGKIWVIPADSANSDYQRYLRWLENPEAEENGTIS